MSLKPSNQYIVVQHEDCTTPGSTLLWLQQNQFEYKVIRPDLGDSFPKVESSLRVIICGGIPNVDQDESFPWLVKEKKWIGELIKNEVPLLGLCLGAQLMAVELGARVFRAQEWEYGWQPLKLSEDFARWMGGESASQRSVFQCHGYQFELPIALKSLGSSEPGPCQGFFKGKSIFAVQFHPEVNQNWIDLCVKTLKPEGRFCETVDKISKSTHVYLADNQSWYFSILNRFFI